MVSPYAAQSIDNIIVNVVKDDDLNALAPAANTARTRSGSLPLDDKTATDYALRSADLMAKLAISRGQVLDLMVAQPNLLGALEDARPEVVKAAGKVLALLDSRAAQGSLLDKAVDDKTADDVKISLFKSTATNAKFFGNRLDDDQVTKLQKVVEAAANLDVRTAAAEARGAFESAGGPGPAPDHQSVARPDHQRAPVI